MPKSKKDNEVSLTKVSKKGKEAKLKLVEEIRKSVDSFTNVFVFTMHGMRSTNIKDLRLNFRDSRFFFGRNNVMAVALGRTPDSEYKDNLHKISAKLANQCALMFTNRPVEEITSYFSTYNRPDFARSGNLATRDVEIEAGALDFFPHSMEPLLRKLGLPVALEKGVVTLTKDHTICKKDNVLTSEQAKLLKLFQLELVEFRANMICYWSADDGFHLIKKVATKKSVQKKKAKKSAAEDHLMETS